MFVPVVAAQLHQVRRPTSSARPVVLRRLPVIFGATVLVQALCSTASSKSTAAVGGLVLPFFLNIFCCRGL
jgi:hypothetical protein